MALHLSEILKYQKWSLGAHFMRKPVLRDGEEKRGRKARVFKKEWFM